MPSSSRLASHAALGVLVLASACATFARGLPPEAPAEVVRELDRHLAILADPALAGRAPGTPGGRRAAEYVEAELVAMGLEPAFDAEIVAFELTEVVERGASHRQPFFLDGGIIAGPSTVTLDAGDGAPVVLATEEASILGFSGVARVEGPLVFAGYAVEDGADGFTSFDDDDDLAGAIAVVLRYEPERPDGGSVLTASGEWGRWANVGAKVRAVQRRGALGVLLVNPPGLATAEERRLVEPGTYDLPDVDPIPGAMVDARRLHEVLRASASGRGLVDLRRFASESRHGVLELTGARATIDANVTRERIETSNVGGILRGAGDLAGEFVILGAHYDHLGLGGAGSRGLVDGGDASGLVHPGADDNASGVAGVLAATRLVRERFAALPGETPRRSVLVLLFGAEERGLLGAQHFVTHAVVARARLGGMVNLDMIGRLDDVVEIHGIATSESWEDLLEPLDERHGLRFEFIPPAGVRSDHAVFDRAGVASIHVFTGEHDDYHRPSDTLERLDVEGAARITAMVADLVVALALRDEPVAHARIARVAGDAPDDDEPAALGIQPGFGAGGAGVLVQNVLPGTSAAEAGLLPGDRIVDWNGEPVEGPRDYVDRLKGQAAGDAVTLTVERGGERVEIEVTLEGAGR